MLELFRRKAQSPYLQAIIIVIVLVFIFWGVGTNRGPGRNAVATVNDQAIAYQDYQRAYDHTLTRYRDQFGGVLPEPLKKALNIQQQVLNQLIDRTLLLQGAAKMGLRVSDDEVRKTIQTMGSFQNNGGFDVERYKAILANSRLTPTSFEANIRTDLLTEKVATTIGRFGRVAPDELDKRFTYDYETITIACLTLAAKDFHAKVAVTDQALDDFFAKQNERYKTAPQIKLQYLFFSTTAGAVPPGTEAIQAYYEQHLDNYFEAEQRRVRHILLRTNPDDSDEKLAATRKRLEDILAQAQAGKDFAALAKKYSEDSSASEGGDLGFFGRGQMIPAFETAAFTLDKPGALSNVVQTQFGFHILQLEATKTAHQRPLAEVKAEISAKLRAEQGSALAFKQANDAYEQIILAGSLAKYAETGNVPVQSTDFFTQQAPPADLAGKQALLSAAFSLKKGELSSLIDDHDGYGILYVTDAKEPEVPALATVREQVRADFVAQEAKRLAGEAAQAALDELRQGTPLAEEAKKLGRDIQHPQPFSRNDRSGVTLPGAVVEQALELQAAAPYPEKVIDTGNELYIIRLLEKAAPATELFAAKEKELRQRLLKENQLALVTAWLQSLKNTAEISLNQELLKD